MRRVATTVICQPLRRVFSSETEKNTYLKRKWKDIVANLQDYSGLIGIIGGVGAFSGFLVRQSMMGWNEAAILKIELEKERKLSQVNKELLKGNIAKERELRQTEITKERALSENYIALERELSEKDIAKERELRQTEITKERALSEKDIAKERELRQKDIALERELRQKDIAHEQELRKSEFERAKLMSLEFLFNVAAAEDFKVFKEKLKDSVESKKNEIVTK